MITYQKKKFLQRQLNHIRKYYRNRLNNTPFLFNIAYFRNKIRHLARKDWNGGYVLENDLLFYIPKSPLDLMASNKLFRPYHAPWLIKKFLPKDGVAVDVGANIGDWTLSMSKCLENSGKVVSFEPIPYMNEALKKSIRANGFKNVILSKNACSNFIGDSQFSIELGNSGGSRIGENPLKSDSTHVKVTTLDEFLKAKEVKRLDLLKIDVEGEEVNVLEGSIISINNFRPACVIEIRKNCKGGTDKVVKLFSSINYTLIGIPTAYGIEECTTDNIIKWDGILSTVDIVDFLFLPNVHNL